MVATVIAIIALLVLPLYRKRVTEAKISAAHDEVASIAKAQLLAEADLGFHIRLQDLDNGEGLAPVTAANSHVLPPLAAWNGTLDGGAPVGAVPTSRTVVVENWQGPYGALTNFRVVADLLDYWYDQSGAGAGFIAVVGQPPFPAHGPSGVDETAGLPAAVDVDRYPVDPWGSPYAYFGDGAFPAGSATESTFNYSVVVSFGPNGVVANDASITTNPQAYRRYNSTDPSETGRIGDEPAVAAGQSDDIIYRF